MAFTQESSGRQLCQHRPHLRKKGARPQATYARLARPQLLLSRIALNFARGCLLAHCKFRERVSPGPEVESGSALRLGGREARRWILSRDHKGVK